jgi:hypothetical protein
MIHRYRFRLPARHQPRVLPPFLLLPALLLSLPALSGFAPRHGIEVTFAWHSPSIVATSTWKGGGGAVVGAAVEVYSPDDGDEPYQTGVTDRNGRFSFVPESAGQWRFIVDDGMGHREVAGYTLPPDFRTLETITPDRAEGSDLRYAGLAVAGILIVAIAIVLVRRASPADR